MGKIRIKALGDQELEEKQKERDEARREGKKLTKLKGKGGGRIVEMEEGPIIETPVEKAKEKEVEIKKKVRQAKVRSHRYQKMRSFIDKTKTYPLEKALELVKKTTLSKFDATLEMHLNTLEKGIRGSVALPYPLGKKLKIAIASDEVLDDIEKGKIDFEVLISSPSFMPRLAKLAKILGPKGLMPNPKNGTISEKPEEAAKKFGESLQFKTESDFPIIHTVIGKVSFEGKKLQENFWALIKSIGSDKIKSVYLKSTMSPSIRVEI